MKAKREGRPQRTERATVAFTPEELEAIDARARETGLSRSDILRSAARPEAAMNVGGAIRVSAIKR
jgi:hypothetical protein